MRRFYLTLALCVSAYATEPVTTHQPGTPLTVLDWTDLTSTLTGLTGTTTPFYVTGWDKYFYVPAINAYCGIGSYYEQSSEPNRSMSCYSFAQNRWWQMDMEGSWHNEQGPEGGHAMGDFIVDPTTSLGHGFQGNSGSQVQNITKWGSFVYDFAAQMGKPMPSMMGQSINGQLGSTAYNPPAQLQIGFDSNGGMIQYDNNGSHTTCTSIGYNCFNSWTLEPTVTLNGLPAAIQETAMAWNSTDNKIYLFGGFGGGQSNNFVYTNTPGAGGAPGPWIALFPNTTTSASCHDNQGGNNCPVGRILAGFAYMAPENLFLMTSGILNGTAPTSGGLTDTWIFDPVAVTWTQVATNVNPSPHVLAFNEITSTLNGTIAPGAVTFTIGTLGNFSAPGIVQIDSEFFYCTTLTSHTFSGCTPGFENSAEVTHFNGATAYTSIEPSAPNERLVCLPEDDACILFLQPSGSNNVHMIAFRYAPGGNAGYAASPVYSYTQPAQAAIGPLNRNTLYNGTPASTQPKQGWAYSESVASDGRNVYEVHTETATTQLGASPANSWQLHPYAQQFSGSSSCGTLDSGYACLGSAYNSWSPDGAGSVVRQAFDISSAVIGGSLWSYWHEEDPSLNEYAYARGWSGSAASLGGFIPYNASNLAACVPTSGSTTAYTCTTTGAFAGFTPINGSKIHFQPDVTSMTCPCTLSLNSQTGPPGLRGITGGNPTVGQLVAGQWYDLTYATSGSTWTISTTAYDGPGQIIGVSGVPTVVYLEQDRTGGSGSPYPVYVYVRQWNSSTSTWNLPLGSGGLNSGTTGAVNQTVNSGFSVADGASIATDGTNIWLSFTIYYPLSVGAIGYTGEFFGPQQVQLWKWNGATWTQQGASGNVLGASCTGSITQVPPPTYAGTSCSRAFSTSLTVLGGIPYVAFNERTDQGILQKLWIRSYNSGWATVGGSTNFLNKDQLDGWTFRPELSNDGTNLLVTWAEQGNPQPWIGSFSYPGNTAASQKPKVYAASMTTTGTVTYLGGALNVDPVNGAATHPSIAVVNGLPVVAWGEVNIGSARAVYVKEWNGSNWGALANPAAPVFGMGGMSLLDLFTGIVWH
jgi:hypothetical protein